jgi:hypothetical protein
MKYYVKPTVKVRVMNTEYPLAASPNGNSNFTNPTSNKEEIKESTAVLGKSGIWSEDE